MNNEFEMSIAGFAVHVHIQEDRWTLSAQRSQQYGPNEPTTGETSVRMVEATAFVSREMDAVPSRLKVHDNVYWLQLLGIDSIEQKAVDTEFLRLKALTGDKNAA